ncbi:MAG: hypothetical protein NW215_14930 [Hyphomicrobiales bacterium]|nr:hypothetical protein [Hyphomicrobiales bacterium]
MNEDAKHRRAVRVLLAIEALLQRDRLAAQALDAEAARRQRELADAFARLSQPGGERLGPEAYAHARALSAEIASLRARRIEADAAIEQRAASHRLAAKTADARRVERDRAEEDRALRLWLEAATARKAEGPD